MKRTITWAILIFLGMALYAQEERIMTLIVAVGACLLLGQSNLLGQSTLSGVVMDGSLGEPLIGTNVTIKGTQVGSITDFEGNYTISSPTDTGTVVFSFVG